MKITISIIKNLWKNKEKLTSIWININANSNTRTLTLDNIFSWWNIWRNTHNNRIGYFKTPYIIVIYKDESPVGILPLMKVVRFRKKVFPIIFLEFITQPLTGEFLDIFQNELTINEIAHVFKCIKEKIYFDVLQLSYIKDESILLKANLGDVILHSGKILIPLNDSYSAIREKIYSKNLRHILNKFNRRINETKDRIQGKVLVNKDEIFELFEQIKLVSLSKLYNVRMHSIYTEKEFGNTFFKNLLDQDSPFCSIFYVNEKLVSFNLGYIKNNTVYAIDAAYDRTYADSQKIGFGILSYDQLIKHFSGQFDNLDMGFGLDDYKFRFSKKLILTYTLLVRGNSLISSFLHNNQLKKLQKHESEIKQKTNNINEL